MKLGRLILVIAGITMLVGAIATPMTADAGPADFYFFLGEWEYTAFGHTTTVDFRSDGTGTFTYENGDEDNFEWKVEDDKLFVRDEGSDEWREGLEYEFDDLYTTLTIENNPEMSKTGHVFGVCCPWCFMWIMVPGLLGLGAIKLVRRRKVKKLSE